MIEIVKKRRNYIFKMNITIAISSPEELKDEAYLQIIKQIINNPNDESKEK